MIKNGHPVSTHRESGIAPAEGETWDTEIDGHRFDELPTEERDLIKAWVRCNFEESDHYSTEAYNSYWFKHRFEQLVGHYVSNDQAKDAFLSWGFKPKDQNEINWVFKIAPYVDRDIFKNGAAIVRARIVSEMKNGNQSDFWKHSDLSRYNHSRLEEWI